ncbi:MAG: diacylglycerol kinase family lipid kinase [Clostridiales bacterium]|jgi:YegS/Rv2252/BmrU family lipid kinase|nr:diacylglycerol kinase family lipid kinase [Clostridiales bacterium]
MLHVILNPVAGKGKGSELKPFIERQLNERRLEYSILETHHVGHSTALAAEAAKRGSDGVIAVGGDGVMLETAVGLLGTEIPFSGIPLGNGNDFVHNLIDFSKCRTDKDRICLCCDAIKAGRTRKLDVIKANDYYSINIANMGFDAESAEYASKIKMLWGSLSYIASVIKNTFTYDSFHAEIEVDGVVKSGRYTLIAVCNGKRYGGGFIIAPQSNAFDGEMTLCLVEHLSRPKILALFPLVLFARHTWLKAVSISNCKSVAIRYEGEKKVCLDGNIYKWKSPALFEIMPKALTAICQFDSVHG